MTACRMPPARFLPNITIDEGSGLPCWRPTNYKWRGWKDAANWTISSSPTSGALTWTLTHAPIANVTPAMIVWLWNNAAKDFRDPRSNRRMTA